MKLSPIILCIFSPCLFAWTLDIDIGEAVIDGNKSKNIHLNAQTENWRDFALIGQAQSLNTGKGSWQTLTLAADAKLSDETLLINRLSSQANNQGVTLSAQILNRPYLRFNNMGFPPELDVELQTSSGKPLRLHWISEKNCLTLEKSSLDSEAFNELLRFLNLPVIKSFTGKIEPDVVLRKINTGWQINADIKLVDGKWQSENQLNAIENVTMRLTLQATQNQERWQGNFSGNILRGEMLFSPVYLNFTKAPITFSSNWQYDSKKIILENAKIQDNALNAQFNLDYSHAKNQLRKIAVDQLSGEVDALYRHYLQPFLGETLFDDSVLTGNFFLSGEWSQKKSWQHMAVVLNHVSLQDNSGRFDFSRIDGQFGQGGQSSISFGKARWRELILDGSTLNFVWNESGARLSKAWRIPVLDGALLIHQLNPNKDGSYHLNMEVEQIDLSELSVALDLPHFTGSISAKLPEVTLNKNSLHFTRNVDIHVFDGDISLKHLKINQLFSGLPVLLFSLDVEALDLQRLTNAFDVGEIEGRLSGYVDNVAVVDWKPTQFSANLHSISYPKTEQRISHEAVRMLTEAGGASAAIGQFVRVLNSFPYEKLGIQAQLSGDKLTLDGVESADDGGFYLVKGKGLPRLDIIGYEHNSSFNELVERIKSASNSEGPVIE